MPTNVNRDNWQLIDKHAGQSNDMKQMNEYRIAGVDVRVVLQVFQDLVQVAIAGRAQEARLGVRL